MNKQDAENLVVQTKISSGKTYATDISSKAYKHLEKLKKFEWVRLELIEILSLIDIKIDKDYAKTIARFKAIIISYGRIFTESKERKYSLNENEVKKYLKENHLLTHDYVLNLRHNFVAHASTDEFEELILNILFKRNRMTIEAVRISKLNFSCRDQELKELINEHIRYFEEKCKRFRNLILEGIDEKENRKLLIASKDYVDESDSMFSDDYAPNTGMKKPFLK